MLYLSMPFFFCIRQMWKEKAVDKKKHIGKKTNKPLKKKEKAGSHSFTFTFPVSPSICVVTEDWQKRITRSQHPSAGRHAVALPSNTHTHTATYWKINCWRGCISSVSQALIDSCKSVIPSKMWIWEFNPITVTVTGVLNPKYKEYIILSLTISYFHIIVNWMFWAVDRKEDD